MPDGSCEFVSTPADRVDAHHDATLSDRDLNDDGEWECPHDALADGLCLAHLDGVPDGVDETDWLLDAVSRETESYRERRRINQFVGGQFEELTIESTVTGHQNTHPLDFRFAEIGSLSCVGLDLTRNVDLSMATVGEVETTGRFDDVRALGADVRALSLDDCRFDRLSFRDASLGRLDFRNGTARTVDLRNARVSGEFDLDDSSITRGRFDFVTARRARGHHATFDVVDFDNATFGTVEFYYAEFGEADFRNSAADDSVFKGAAFDGAYFGASAFGVANWIGADVESGSFARARFEQVSFRKATFGSVNYGGSYFGWVNFGDAAFDRADFSGATFEQGVFRGAEFGSADFTGIDCVGALNLRGTTFDDEIRIRPDPDAPPTDSFVDLSDSELAAGVVAQSDAGRVIYDLQGATVGTVSFEDDGDDTELIRNVRFLRTRFESFDFRDSDDIDLERTRYRLHETFDGAEALVARLRRYGVAVAEAKRRSSGSGSGAGGNPGVAPWDPASNEYRALRSRVDDRLVSGEIRPGVSPNFRNPPASDLEYTYLLAKNGANAIHDNESSSMFFVHEMQQRRRRHAELARDAGLRSLAGLGHALDWLKNAVFGVTTDYGESPSRVIATSVAVIGLFSLAYYALAPGLYGSASSFVALSIGSFVTLIVGDIGDVPVSSIRLLAQAQAFVGAFLIAMFVFTLTRAIHR